VDVGYLIVVAISLLVGVAVFVATLWAGREEELAVGFGGEPAGEAGADEAGAGYTYLRVSTRGTSWRERLQGLVGLIVLLTAAAAALALGIYQLGHLINRTIERFLQQ